MDENRDLTRTTGEEAANRDPVNAGGEPEFRDTQAGPAYGEPGYRESVDFGRQEGRKTAEFRRSARNSSKGDGSGAYHSRYDAYRFRTPDPESASDAESSSGEDSPSDTGSAGAAGTPGGFEASGEPGARSMPGTGNGFNPEDPDDRWKRILFGAAIAAVTVALAVVIISGVSRLVRSGRTSGAAPSSDAVSTEEEVRDETADGKSGISSEEDEAVSSVIPEKEEEQDAGEAEAAGDEADEDAAADAEEEPAQGPVSGEPGNTEMNVQDVVRKVMPSMVSITNVSVQEYRSYNGLITSRDSVSSGSGFIVSISDDAILIATNYHVIANAENITAAFVDESTASGTVKGVDADSDLAVIEVSPSELEKETRDAISVITFGDSDALEVGEPVVAIGNALGYGQSVSSGIVSALNRVLEDTDGTVREMIQTDASINPGNSGGALLNMSGELVGINEIKYVDTNVEGVGYAIPAATARPIIDRLQNSVKKEPVASGQEAYLGVTIATVPQTYIKTGGYPAGACVIDLTEGGPADKAGILVNDIITSVEGSAVNSQEDLLEELSYYAAGEEIRITVSRPDTEAVKFNKVSVTVTLGSRAEAVENGLMTEDGKPIGTEEETEEETEETTEPGGDLPGTAAPDGEAGEEPEAADLPSEEAPEASDTPAEEVPEAAGADQADGSQEAHENEESQSKYDFGGLFGGSSDEFNFKDFFR